MASRPRAGYPLAMIGVLALALAVRIPFLPFESHLPGNYSDMQCWTGWSQAISQHGLVNVFDTTDINYVGYDYFLWFVAALNRLLSNDWSTSSVLLRVLLKTAPVAFDLALVAATFLLTRTLLRQRPGIARAATRRFPILLRLSREPATALALLAGGLIALQPALIYDSAAWAQTDGIITFFMVSSILAMAWRRPGLAFFLWALGFMVKPHPIVMLPALIAFAWWSWGWKGLARGALGAIAATLLTTTFWIVQGKTGGLLHVYHMLFTPGEVVSMQAWNVWWFASYRDYPSPENPLLNIANLTLTYRDVSLALFTASIALGLLYLRRNVTLIGLLEVSAFATFAFFMLPVASHERYMIPVAGLLAPVLFLKPRWIPAYLALSFTMIVNVYLVGPLQQSISGRYTNGSISLAVAALNTLVLALWIAAFSWGAARSPATVRLPKLRLSPLRSQME